MQLASHQHVVDVVVVVPVDRVAQVGCLPPRVPVPPAPPLLGPAVQRRRDPHGVRPSGTSCASLNTSAAEQVTHRHVGRLVQHHLAQPHGSDMPSAQTGVCPAPRRRRSASVSVPPAGCSVPAPPRIPGPRLQPAQHAQRRAQRPRAVGIHRVSLRAAPRRARSASTLLHFLHRRKLPSLHFRVLEPVLAHYAGPILDVVLGRHRTLPSRPGRARRRNTSAAPPARDAAHPAAGTPAARPPCPSGPSRRSLPLPSRGRLPSPASTAPRSNGLAPITRGATSSCMTPRSSEARQRTWPALAQAHQSLVGVQADDRPHPQREAHTHRVQDGRLKRDSHVERLKPGNAQRPLLQSPCRSVIRYPAAMQPICLAASPRPPAWLSRRPLLLRPAAPVALLQFGVHGLDSAATAVAST